MAHDMDIPGRRRTAARRTAVGVVALVLMGACSGTEDRGADAPSRPAPSSASQPAASQPEVQPEVQPEPTTSPYSGREGGVGTPVMVVKYDNTPAAQPHRGLPAADVVYVEEVEWGLTRIAAVFSTQFPQRVGPVRSARVSDLDLFAQYGPVAFVYSGAQRRLQPAIAAAPWIPVSPEVGSGGFLRERGTGRVAPTNMMAVPEVILEDVGDQVGLSSDMGWVFDEQRPAGGKLAGSVTARWPSSRVQLRWNAKKDVWDVWMHGRPARDTDPPGVQRASTAIIQYVKQTDSGYGDKFGGVTPMVHTVGRGKGVLLRDGRTYPITWQRPDEQAPTEYLDGEGQPISLDPGQVWILLVDRTRPVTVQR